ncbi:NAD(P)H-binding protein [Denitrobaculum tricleocarpae]|uniref:NAD(P)-binding domain-containing protein n=1 Tax=Denitrobaculum tricleocarpae TaxID=2591009 RepID=A0A545U2D5_9PROT|nr:NAD(P)H-binding protein [Denitrobaculum tricleocarpae]TQV83631.1 hypothetical protein FKG95_03300 [Denitrobaculum tricleocarpae]
MTRVVMLGATGAVGTEVVRALTAMEEVGELVLVGRSAFNSLEHPKIRAHTADVFDPAAYAVHLAGAEVAICTFGVGQPSKVIRQDFLRIDRDAVLAFGRACKEAGVSHFQLLSSVGADANSLSFFLRAKGELEEGLQALGFDRLSLFHPSMILTPTNRYGLSQALVLALWPRLSPVFFGRLKKYRGIEVEKLGRAIALNLRRSGQGSDVLEWPEIMALASNGKQVRPPETS